MSAGNLQAHVPSPARPQRRRPPGVDRLLHPALRHRARQGEARLRQLRGGRACSEAGPDREPRSRWLPEPPRRRGRRHRHGRHRADPAGRGRPGLGRRARLHVLLRQAGQVLGRGRPRRRALGGLHRPRGQPGVRRPRGRERDDRAATGALGLGFASAAPSPPTGQSLHARIRRPGTGCTAGVQRVPGRRLAACHECPVGGVSGGRSPPAGTAGHRSSRTGRSRPAPRRRRASAGPTG